MVQIQDSLLNDNAISIWMIWNHTDSSLTKNISKPLKAESHNARDIFSLKSAQQKESKSTQTEWDWYINSISI